MKKLNKMFIVLLALFIGVGVGFAEQGDLWQPDTNGMVRLMSDDGMTPTTFYMRCNLRVSSPIYSVDGYAKADVYDNLVAASSVTYVDIYISTTVLAAGASTFYIPESAQPTVARDIVFAFAMDKTTNSVNCPITINGKNARNQAISPVVIGTHTSVATLNAFAWITSYTIGAATLSADVRNGLTGLNTEGGSVRFAMGTGNKIGFRGDLDTSSDLIGVTVQTGTTKVQELSSVTVNYQYDTWTHSDVPDGADDYYMYYISHVR